MKRIKKLVEAEIAEQEAMSPEETRTEFVRGRLHGLHRVLYFISQEEAKEGGSPLFDEFWKAYPNKKAKPIALKKWKSLKVDAELFALIMTALNEHKKTPQWTKDNGQYIPHPSTWLNQRRWEDELKVEKSSENQSKFGAL